MRSSCCCLAPAPASAAQASAYELWDWTYVEIVTEREGESKMAILEVWGDLEAIPTGQRRTYHYEGDGSDGFASVIGCAGPVRHDWDVDDVAEIVHVETQLNESNPEVRTYRFTAHFGSDGSPAGTSTLVGSFVAP